MPSGRGLPLHPGRIEVPFATYPGDLWYVLGPRASVMIPADVP